MLIQGLGIKLGKNYNVQIRYILIVPKYEKHILYIMPHIFLRTRLSSLYNSFCCSHFKWINSKVSHKINSLSSVGRDPYLIITSTCTYTITYQYISYMKTFNSLSEVCIPTSIFRWLILGYILTTIPLCLNPSNLQTLLWFLWTKKWNIVL